MYSDFSSMPPDQERAFVVFEQRTRESEKSAWRMGGIVAAIYGVLMVAIVFSHDKPPPLIAEDDIAVTEPTPRPSAAVEDDLGEPTPSPAAEVTPSPGAEPMPSPGAEPTPSPGAEGAEGAAEGTGEPVAPPPSAGATKASPTDLVKANE
jgi:hypothetical protein